MSQTSTVITPTQIALVDRFILTQVAESTLVFPAAWVAEIIRIDRSQILDLPFSICDLRVLALLSFYIE